MKSLMLVVLTLAGLSLLTGCACCGAKPLGSGAGAPARCRFSFLRGAAGARNTRFSEGFYHE
jgi:hypothetical protein